MCFSHWREIPSVTELIPLLLGRPTQIPFWTDTLLGKKLPKLTLDSFFFSSYRHEFCLMFAPQPSYGFRSLFLLSSFLSALCV